MEERGHQHQPSPPNAWSAALGLGQGERRCDPRQGLIPGRPAPPPCLHSPALRPWAPRSAPPDHRADLATCQSRWVWTMPFCAHSRSGVYSPKPPPCLPPGTLSPLLPSSWGQGQTVGSTLTQAHQDQSTHGPDPSPWPADSLAGATVKALGSTSPPGVLASPHGYEVTATKLDLDQPYLRPQDPGGCKKAGLDRTSRPESCHLSHLVPCGSASLAFLHHPPLRPHPTTLLHEGPLKPVPLLQGDPQLTAIGKALCPSRAVTVPWPESPGHHSWEGLRGWPAPARPPGSGRVHIHQLSRDHGFRPQL